MMKKVLSVNQSSTGIDIALFIARVSVGIFMLVHGLPKMISLFSAEPIQFVPVFGLSPAISLALAVFAEVFCSILLIAGLGTRLAVIPLIVTMLVAVFVIHINDPFAKQELGLHYLLVYTILFITGSGKISIDYLIAGRQPVLIKEAKNWDDPTLSIYQ
jgi:putative oxidoreductase